MRRLLATALLIVVLSLAVNSAQDIRPLTELEKVKVSLLQEKKLRLQDETQLIYNALQKNKKELEDLKQEESDLKTSICKSHDLGDGCSLSADGASIISPVKASETQGKK